MTIDTAEPINAWHSARQKRLQARHTRRAENAEQRVAEYSKKARLDEDATGIPFGQPILVGHHSERKHRNALKRAEVALHKCVEADREAKHERSLAEGAGNDGIRSDDPDVISLLEQKFDALAGVKGPRASRERQQIKKRLAILRGRDAAIAALTDAEKQGAGVRFEVADNRVRLFFDEKPDADARGTIKSWGFRWSPYAKAWQRMADAGSIRRTRAIIKRSKDGGIDALFAAFAADKLRRIL